jgi:putative RecB family exonuclease
MTTTAAAGLSLGLRPAEPTTQGSLSPSRASDFLTCPLLFRFRTIDRLAERPSPAAVRGTVVHAVLERLFDLEPLARTPEAAVELLRPEWERLLAAEPEVGELFSDDTDGTGLAGWLDSARTLVEGWFALEDPTRLSPAARELRVECELPSGLSLRGYVDRLDEAPDGALRIVDYKTGRSPNPDFEARALFQMRFYALVIWRSRGVLPRVLQLVYLSDGVVLRYTPDEADLRATERKVEALWTAIRAATVSGDWRPRSGPLCGFCDHKALCPAFGGTPPPLPTVAAVDLGRSSPVDQLA